ncbi:YciI family protein [Cellulomonas sp. KH9]|uniref:YciI family protein n=1 Tax=Cellulomonas sp. KH9 TaxID=1855324 RepID=UPI000B7C59F5|nr:YciI family protein [Cellulomonas sp. KH9]
MARAGDGRARGRGVRRVPATRPGTLTGRGQDRASCRNAAGPRASTVVDATGDGPALRTDGPFVETTEYVAGFWVVDAADHATALALATAASRACRRRVELRPFL